MIVFLFMSTLFLNVSYSSTFVPATDTGQESMKHEGIIQGSQYHEIIEGTTCCVLWYLTVATVASQLVMV
jgi:hypothetical protein